jgi:hypothetical protein
MSCGSFFDQGGQLLAMESMEIGFVSFLHGMME